MISNLHLNRRIFDYKEQGIIFTIGLRYFMKITDSSKPEIAEYSS